MLCVVVVMPLWLLRAASIRRIMAGAGKSVVNDHAAQYVVSLRVRAKLQTKVDVLFKFVPAACSDVSSPALQMGDEYAWPLCNEPALLAAIATGTAFEGALAFDRFVSVVSNQGFVKRGVVMFEHGHGQERERLITGGALVADRAS